MANQSTTNPPGLPQPVRQEFEDLCDDVSLVHAKWVLYQHLFGTPESIRVLNVSVPGCFHLVEDSLRSDMTMSIGRLMDLPKSMGKDNLSLERLIQGLAPYCDQQFLDNLKAKLTSLRKHCEAITQWRNRHVGHNDLATALRYHPDP